MNNDLINRKAVSEVLYDISSRNYGSFFGHGINKACDVIEHTETAFDKEKVIEEMKKTGKRFCVSVRCSEDCQNCEHGALMKALIEIVKKGGIE